MHRLYRRLCAAAAPLFSSAGRIYFAACATTIYSLAVAALVLSFSALA